MPEQAPPIPVYEQAKVIAWLQEQWKSTGGKCPMCAQDRWMIGESFVQMQTLSPAGTVPTRTYPAVMVVCMTCGNTLFFSAVIMKLFPPGGDVPTPSEVARG